MKKNKIISYIKNIDVLNKEEISQIDNLILKYPYFQTSYLILAKMLLISESIRYNNFLKKAAAICINRKNLFNIIKLEKSQKPILRNLNTIEKKKNISSTLKFNDNESYSFSEWLSIHNLQKINRKDRSSDKLINKFLEQKISIKNNEKTKFFKAPEAAKESLIENTELVTPTLAKVYFEQQHYKKAIDSYKKLILKYPKKSTFFAAQIELIKNKIKCQTS
tara:strand:- start:2648 stop:3310 length:663 start_codon:yes stop_codon:yes gene_type:complete